MKLLRVILAALAVSLGAHHALAANFNGVYFENFDSMGTAGTTPPSGWSVYGAFGGTNATFTTTIPASGAVGGTQTTTVTAATTFTGSSNTNGFNYALSTATADRCLGTSPTTGAGTALQLSLTNTTGAAVNAIQISYDTRRFTVASPAANELPGYWLFYSLDNGLTWTNAAATNPTITTVPNTTGTTVLAPNTITLSSAWASNGTLLLRWMDDNAAQSSPDQVIGLDNVCIALPVTTPANQALLFNGASYVTMGAATATLGASNLTVECWFKRTGTGTATSTGTGGVTNAIPLVTKGRGEAEASNVDCNYFLGIDATTNKLCADFEAQAGVPGITAGQNYPIIGTTVIQNDTWYHAAVTYDTGTHTWNLYLNGVLDATFTNPAGAAPRNDSIQHFGIGTAMTSTGVAAGFFQGVIDEARVWNIARSGTQIAAAKNLEITSATTGLLARYGLNEGTGTSASNTVGTAGAPVGTLTNNFMWVNGAPIGGNSSPIVALTSPVPGTTAALSAGVALTATASDTDGTVTQVEFLRDGSVIGTVTTVPYAFTDTTVTAGVHTYAARATDNNLGTTTTGTVSVSVLTDPNKTALLFDGVNDYVTMGVATELGVGGPPSNGFTLECWFRKEGMGVTSSSGNGGVVGVPLFGKGRGEAENSNVDCDYFFGINTSGQLVADFEAYPAAGITAGQNYPIIGTNAAIQNNVWHHAAVTYDGNTSTWTLYLDGVASGTATAAAGALPRFDSIQHFGIGAAFTSTGVAEGAFAGRIDEVRVWNYARSAAEIAAAKDFEIASAPGLVGRYGLNEGTGTTTANNVGVAGAPVGTLTNGPIWVDGAPLAANTAPVVALTAPTDGTTVMSGAVVTLAANASDSDGIARVEFYAGSTKLGQATTAPYSFDWTTSTPGDYTITAKAFDNLGTTSDSAAVTVHVVPNVAPTVALTAPANSTTLTAPAIVDITANASDSDGTIAKVEFFNGAAKLGEAIASPYIFHWTTIPAGDYTLTAKATDNLGAATTSAAVTLHVLPPNTLPPVVAIASPANGANFSSPATVSITATASDPDGTVAKVEFFNGASKIGEATSAPFSFSWTNVAQGDYVLTAKATDDMTATTVSAPITIHVMANQAPVVTLTAPADNATGIGSSTNLQLGIADPEGDAQTVTYYGRVTAPTAPGPDFSLIAIPDTQYYSENTARNPSSGGTGAVAGIYNAQMQWIVDNRTTRNIAFVSHMGDVAQNGDSFESEWQVANTAQKIIENPATSLRAHGIPWGVAPGNHDQTPNGDAGGTTNFFNQYFNFSRWDKRPYYGGHFGSKGGIAANNNNYELFSAGGLDFIVVHMEYDIRVKTFYQPVLDWADALLKAYPNRRAIITSHWVVNTGNPATFSTQGQDIYNALKNNPNFFLMLCGHVQGEGQRSDTFSGRTVYSLLQDYQESLNGGNGFFRIYTFSPANNRVHVESYSPTQNRAVNASDSVPGWTTAFDLNYNMQSAVTDWIPLGTVNVPAAGTTASLNWTGLEGSKNYEWYATVNDGTNTVTTATRRFSTATLSPPTVALTSPTDGGFASLGAAINLTATANDADGTVVRVEFFDGGTKIGESTSAPYTLAWSGATAGVHALTAVATDDSGLDAISSIVTLNVNNAPPTVVLTSPDTGVTYDAPASICMAADATDTDGTIVKVEYFQGSTKIGEATTAPYGFFWNGVFTGVYTLTAKATDNGGATTTSAPLTITVTNTDNVAPAVAITAPTAGAIVSPGTVTVTAGASDTDGLVSKVEFFNGATKIGQATAAPYTISWSSVAVGSYTVTAVATDNDGGVTTSTPVAFTVQAAPLSFSQDFNSMGTSGTTMPSGWSFIGYTAGTNATWVSSIPATDVGGGTANATLIQTTTFDTTNTKSATQGYNFALSTATADRCLGTSPTSTEGVALQWSVTNTSANAVTAVRIGYDTRRFTAAATANELPGYWLFYSLDNGVTWTNASALNPTLSGSSGVVVPNTTGVTTIPPTDVTLSSAWGVGATLLFRWVDDNAVATSADQIIGLDNVTLTVAQAQVGTSPTVALTAPLATDTFVAPATINLAANASDADGTVTKVEFFNGASKLGESTTAPYAFSWTGVAAGTYSLSAHATDNDGNITVSSPVSVTVNPAPGSGTLTRGPYLQKAAPTLMTIRWRSSQSITGRVKYGLSAGALTNTVDETAAATDHEIALTGLSPSTTYFYSIGSAFDTLAGGDANYTFITPPVAGSAPAIRFWALGDAGTGTSSQTSVRDAFYTWTGSRNPDLVLQLGDNAYNSGLDSEFQAKVFDIYGSLMRKVPFWSCLGNHETNQATAFVDTYPYFDVYTFPKSGECGGVASGTEHYYSFDYGNVHFISLDSMTASRSSTGAMATWLQNDLASTTATWIVAFWHHPPYTKDSHDSDTETELIEMRSNILPILEAGGVDLVLSGHSHAYERSYLLDGHYGLSSTLTSAMKKNGGDGRVSGNGAYTKPLFGNRSHFGAVYCVTGSAGQTSGGSLNHPAHYISLNNLGSTVVDISNGRLDLTFLRETGATNDTFTILKQGGSTAPIVATSAASNVTATTATLNATVNPTGTSSTVKIQSGPNVGYGTDTAVTLSPNDGLSSQPVSVTLTNLLPGTTYHYRISATNSWGTVTGSDVAFTTLQNNADLNSLTLSSGALSPVFAASTTSYTAAVSNATPSITVTPTVADATATVQSRVNAGTYGSVTSGSASSALPLNLNANPVDVKVTAQDGTTKVYTVNVTRATMFDEWAPTHGLTGPNAGPNADADHDGVRNIAEYAFGMNPMGSDQAGIQFSGSTLTQHGAPIAMVSGTDMEAVFCRRKDAASAGLTYTVSFSADLVNWTTSVTAPTVIAADAEVEAVKVPFPILDGKQAQFFRVNITAP